MRASTLDPSRFRWLVAPASAALCAAVALSSCGGSDVQNHDPGTDAGAVDSGGNPDGGADAGGADAGNSDGGVDAGDADAGDVDAGNADAGDADAGDLDAGNPDAGDADAGDLDAGTGDLDAGSDAGAPDGGVDAGIDGGTGADGGTADGGTDAGVVLAPHLDPPSSNDVHQVPGPNLISASADEGGNVWGVSSNAIWLLRDGSNTWEQFPNGSGDVGTAQCTGGPCLNDGLQSIEGGAAGEAWVGYRGLFQDGESDGPTIPIPIKESGGVERFFATPTGIERDRSIGSLCDFNVDARHPTSGHLVFCTPPGELTNEPTGRWKVRSIYAIRYNHAPAAGHPEWKGDVWFGGTHGTGYWSHALELTGARTVQEHQHAAINYCAPGQLCSLVAGDHYGLALHPSGNVWAGANFASVLIPFATHAPRFDKSAPNQNPGSKDSLRTDCTDQQRSAFCLTWGFRAWEGHSQDVDPTKAQYHGRDFVQAMDFDANGDLWVGSYQSGLMKAPMRPDATVIATNVAQFTFWNHLDGITPPWPRDTYDYVWTVRGDLDGSVWVGGPHGAYRGVGATGQWVAYNSVLVGQNVNQISLDPRPGVRKVYLATSRGLTIYSGK